MNVRNESSWNQHTNRRTANLPSHAMAQHAGLEARNLFYQELRVSFVLHAPRRSNLTATKTATEDGIRKTRSRKWSTTQECWLRLDKGGNKGRRRSVNPHRKCLGDDVVMLQRATSAVGMGPLPPSLRWCPAGERLNGMIGLSPSARTFCIICLL